MHGLAPRSPGRQRFLIRPSLRIGLGLATLLAGGLHAWSEPGGRTPAALLVAASAGTGSTLRQQIERWTGRDEFSRWLDAGDQLAGLGGHPGPLSTATRTLYLLAFHAAQDAADARALRAVAGRFACLGDRVLAARALRVVADLDPGRPADAATPGPEADDQRLASAAAELAHGPCRGDRGAAS